MKTFLRLSFIFFFFDGVTAYSQDSSATPEENTLERTMLAVFEEADNMDEYLWMPSGWMPDGEGISFQPNSTDNPHGGETCIKAGFNAEVATKGWVGIYWLANDSWEGPGINVYEELDVEKGTPIILTFWARGENGGERVQFSVGGVNKGNDSISFPVKTKWIKLANDWKQYKIDLSEKDLTNVVGGFCWVIDKKHNRGQSEVWFMLDDIKYEIK